MGEGPGSGSRIFIRKTSTKEANQQCNGFTGSSSGKKKKQNNLSANAGDIKDMGLIPELRRSPRGEQDNPLQYSHLENSMDKRAWWATVHSVAKSWTGLKRLSTYMRTT